MGAVATYNIAKNENKKFSCAAAGSYIALGGKALVVGEGLECMVRELRDNVCSLEFSKLYDDDCELVLIAWLSLNNRFIFK